MTAILPGFLWLFALLWALGICAMCLVNGALRKKDDHRKVETVQWSVVIMQIVSMFLCCAPYGVYKLLHAQIHGIIRHLYAMLGIPSAVILGIFFVAELVLMYLQAKQAQRSIIDEVLSKRHHHTTVK
ncbi:hypothetical protein OZX72_04890 [Bifidobacterium sp. ESL0769]|uniref:hypothetical protein n=1 Tax=Bifidobacterium sp. ESL0769 TaxID=2983229 RepID=UPI0023F7DFC2|nr:hypothetical protein [Bifidobacterium sp. ESL0769]WEV68308.1 hypothetical protein OZX72_04890 [Bifidobacterium sp. ESL0769]